MDFSKGRGVYKKEVYEKYAHWKFLPSQLKELTEEHIRKLGINEDEVLRLLKIKTQTEFTREFGILDLGTLSDWNKRLKTESSIAYTRYWSKFLDGNVVLALYKKILQDPKSNDVKTWFSINENL